MSNEEFAVCANLTNLTSITTVMELAKQLVAEGKLDKSTYYTLIGVLYEIGKTVDTYREESNPF